MHLLWIRFGLNMSVDKLEIPNDSTASREWSLRRALVIYVGRGDGELISNHKIGS
jgi:hypothetical protein